MSQEAMKLALEALDVLLTEPIAHKAADRAEYLLLQAAPAIRKALAEEPAQHEPVAWAKHTEKKLRFTTMPMNYEGGWRPLVFGDTSPQAQRKPLTDEQWQSIADTLGCIITRGQKDAIEAAHGIKENT